MRTSPLAALCVPLLLTLVGCIDPTLLACPAGLTACGGACVDVSSDPANCGHCGQVCGAELTCDQGSCGLPCTPCPSGSFASACMPSGEPVCAPCSVCVPPAVEQAACTPLSDTVCSGGCAPPCATCSGPGADQCTSCAPGLQDNDQDGTCFPTCATSGLGACSGHGACDDTSGLPICVCDPGFGGPICAEVSGATCTPDPCQNGGVCTTGPGGGAVCACPPGTFGGFCELVPPCPTPPNATLAWAMDLPVSADFDTDAQLPYGYDVRPSLIGSPYARVGYCLELDGNWAYAEMDDFTGSSVMDSGLTVDALYAVPVLNLDVVSSVASVPLVQHGSGNVEMYSNCYDAAANGVCDYDDFVETAATDCYGSFQVFADQQTVLAYNGWSAGGGVVSDLGIGPAPSGNPDWTNAANAASYSVRRLYGYIVSAVPVTSGLVAHYDATDFASQITNGPELTQWNDSSGQGHHLLVDGNAPLVNSGSIHGLPAIDFDGADRRMSTLPFALAPEVTVFAVVEWRSPEAFGNIAHHGSRDTDWSLEQNGVDGVSAKTHFQSENDNTGVEQLLETGGDYILVGRLGATREYTVVGPNSSNTSTVSGGGSSIVPGDKKLFVGSSDILEDSRAYIGEILYYDRALSDVERDQVTAYLAQHWFFFAPKRGAPAHADADAEAAGVCTR